jgi:hypothetical protein
MLSSIPKRSGEEKAGMQGRIASITVALIIAGAALVASARPCAACSCAPSTPEDHEARATEVFLGRVTEIGEASRASTLRGNWRITFAVERVWRGPLQLTNWALGGAAKPIPGQDVIVHNTCNIPFVEGERYLIVLTAGGRGTDTCGASTIWDPADPLLDLLGPGVGIAMDADTHARTEALIDRTHRLPAIGGIVGMAARAVELGSVIVLPGA